MEISKSHKCSFVYYDNNSKDFPCEHPSLEKDDFCIFHSKNIKGKEEFFINALGSLIARTEKNRNFSCYNFRGFIFPKINFKNKTFIKELDLRKAEFIGFADFENCEFESDIICHKTIFHDKLFLQGAIFKNNVSFVASEFNKLILVGGLSENKFVFHGCKFYENVVFRGRSFQGNLIFHSSIFYKDVDFQWAKFHKLFDLSNSTFHNKLEFNNAQFFDDVNFSNTNISIIKNLNAPGVSFDGAILQQAQFNSITEFINYSFNNGFLLSLDFSNKAFKNCDFTGCVLKSIRSDNTVFDQKTVENTQYIFTDYIIKKDDSLEHFIPNQNSRVPLVGNFGDQENKYFTFLDYLKEQYKWSFLLDLPDEIRTGILNYINFFWDYSKKVLNENVNVTMVPEGSKTRVNLLVDNSLKEINIIDSFQQYIKNIFKPFSELNIEFRNTNLSEFQKAKFLIDYENELNTTQINLKYGIQFLSDSNKLQYSMIDFLLSQKDRQIESQEKYINQLIESIPKTQNINVSVNQNLSNVIKNKLDLEIDFSKMLDELDKSKASNENLVNELKQEIENIKAELKNSPDAPSTKERIKKFIKTLGKIGNYGLQNYDTIMKIGKAISDAI